MEITKRNLADNIKYRRQTAAIKKVEAKIGEIESELEKSGISHGSEIPKGFYLFVIFYFIIFYFIFY